MADGKIGKEELICCGVGMLVIACILNPVVLIITIVAIILITPIYLLLRSGKMDYPKK